MRQGTNALRLLLEHEAEPNSRIKRRDVTTRVYTPLLRAIKHRNCDAIRILCEFGASFEEIVKDYELSHNLYLLDHWQTDGIDEDALKTMIQCGYEVHSNHKYPKGGFLHFAKPRNVLVLAELGYRYDVAVGGKRPLAKSIDRLSYFSCTHVTAYALKICTLLAMRDDLVKYAFEDSEFDQFLVSLRSYDAVRIILQSGYCPKQESLRSLQQEDKIKADDMKDFWETHPLPLTLERLAANVIRKSLQPNAVVGVKRLVETDLLPLPYFSTFITFGVTKQNVSSLQWSRADRN